MVCCTTSKCSLFPVAGYPDWIVGLLRVLYLAELITYAKINSYGFHILVGYEME